MSMLISDYSTVQRLQLRECGSRPHPKDSPISTYRLTYYVDYTTLFQDANGNLKTATGNHHDWNVLRDGFPTLGNLSNWARKHEALADSAEVQLLVVVAELRATADGTVYAKVYPHGA